METEHKIALAAAAVSAVTFGALAGPSLGWQDSGELISAAFQLGVAHPTGFPPILMMAKLLALGPVGSVAFRVALLSVIGAAACVGLAAMATTRLCSKRFHAPSWVAAMSGAVTALGLGCSLSFIQNATVLEAYTPALATLLVMLLLVVSQDRNSLGGKGVCLLALCFGVGSTAHVTVRFHGAIPLLFGLLGLSAGRTRRRAWAWTGLAVILGLVVNAYLPIASLRDGPLDWGNPETLGALIDHLGGGRIRRAFDDRMLNPAWLPMDLEQLANLIADDMSVVLCCLACIGAGGLLKAFPKAAALLLALAAVDAAYCLLLNPMGMVDRQVALPLQAALAILAGLGVGAIGGAAGSRPVRPVLATMTAVVAAALAATAATRAEGPEHGPACLVTDALAVPPRAAILCSSDTLCGGLLWAQYVEGARPDVVALPRQHLWDQATLQARLTRHAPDLWPAVADGSGLGLEQALTMLSSTRPVFWERGGDGPWLRSTLGASSLGPSPYPLLHRVGRTENDVAEAARILEATATRWYGGDLPPDQYGRATLSRAYQALAPTAAESGDRALAAVLLQQALELHLDPSALLNMSALAVGRGDESAALRFVELALEQEPGSVRGLVAAGRLHLAAGHDYQARPFFDRARLLCPTRCGAPLEGLGILKARSGRFREAEALLQEAIRREPWLEDARINLDRLEHVGP